MRHEFRIKKIGPEFFVQRKKLLFWRDIKRYGSDAYCNTHVLKRYFKRSHAVEAVKREITRYNNRLAIKQQQRENETNINCIVWTEDYNLERNFGEK